MLGQRVINNILGNKPKTDRKSKNKRYRFGFREENVGPTLWKQRHNIVDAYHRLNPDPWFGPDDLVTVANFDMALDFVRGQGHDV